jgi:uncharacterized membrane protein
MKGILIFICGFAAGILLTLFVLFIIGIGISSNYANYKDQAQHINDKVQVQYVTVKGKKGNAELYTGMPKDSVRMLVGKPDEVHLNSIGNSTYEHWGFKLKNKYISDLEVDFEDGKLRRIRQY